MTDPIFDHEKLDVYRLSVHYIAFSYKIAKTLQGSDRHIRDQWLRASQSIALNLAEGNGKRSLLERNRFFQIARGSALECAAVHDILLVSGVTDEDQNLRGKAELKRIVSMLTRLIQRSRRVPGGKSRTDSTKEYEYEYENE